MAGKRAAPATKAANRPANVTNPAAGHPPANYPAPAAHMPAGPDVTHISLPAAWPTTAPVLGGVDPGAPPSGVDSPPTPDIGAVGLDRPLPDSNLPRNLGVPPVGGNTGPGPSGVAMNPPAIGMPNSNPGGEVPFTPTDTTEQGR